MDDKTLYTPLTLDVQHVNFPDVIAVSKDTLRGWLVTPLNDGALLDLVDGDTCELWSISASQDIPVFSQGQVEDGKLILPILPEMLQDGYVTQTVVLKRASGTVRFGSFRLWVDGAVDDYGSTGGAGKSQWQDMLDKLNDALAKSEHYRNEAMTSASLAAECQEKACECATKAEESKAQAEASAERAKTNADGVDQYSKEAKASAEAAKASETAAQTSAETASTKASEAATSASKAKASETAAASSATEAKSSETAAAESSDTAKRSADDAAQSRASAATSASTATTKAGEASQSASVAVDAKNAAVTAKGQAAASASAAKTSAGSASASATSAGESKTAAETAKNQAQEIADSLQGTVDSANLAADRANDAAKKAEQATQAVQPDATKTSKGIVQVGKGIEVANGIISVDLQISDITGLDQVLAEAGKVQSVNDQTGAVKINAVPDGGTVGQVLKKTRSGYAWGEDKDTKPDLSPYAKTADIEEALDKKVGKVIGKGLSTNDYDNAAKEKVDAIPSNPKYTDTTYSNATKSTAGLMSGADKSKLNGIEAGATKTTVLDSLTSTSATSALSANQGRILKEQITQTAEKFGEVSRLKVLTQAEFEALSTKDPGTLYLVKEG